MHSLPCLYLFPVQLETASSPSSWSSPPERIQNRPSFIVQMENLSHFEQALSGGQHRLPLMARYFARFIMNVVYLAAVSWLGGHQIDNFPSGDLNLDRIASAARPRAMVRTEAVGRFEIRSLNRMSGMLTRCICCNTSDINLVAYLKPSLGRPQ